MDRMRSGVISRRRLLAFSAAAGAGVLARVRPGVLDAAAPKTKQAYYLDPEWGAGLATCPVPHDGGASCHACVACHGHSQKRFISSLLADFSRAHPRCKCVVRTLNLSEQQYVRLFGPPAGPMHRDQFDPRRDNLWPAAAGSKKGE